MCTPKMIFAVRGNDKQLLKGFAVIRQSCYVFVTFSLRCCCWHSLRTETITRKLFFRINSKEETWIIIQLKVHRQACTYFWNFLKQYVSCKAYNWQICCFIKRFEKKRLSISMLQKTLLKDIIARIFFQVFLEWHLGRDDEDERLLLRWDHS